MLVRQLRLGTPGPVRASPQPEANRASDRATSPVFGEAGSAPSSQSVPRQIRLKQAERRRSRTYRAVGCTTAPVLKIHGEIPLCRDLSRRAPVGAPQSRSHHGEPARTEDVHERGRPAPRRPPPTIYRCLGGRRLRTASGRHDRMCLPNAGVHHGTAAQRAASALTSDGSSVCITPSRSSPVSDRGPAGPASGSAPSGSRAHAAARPPGRCRRCRGRDRTRRRATRGRCRREY